MEVRLTERWHDDEGQAKQALALIEALVCHHALRRMERAPAADAPAPPGLLDQEKVPQL